MFLNQDQRSQDIKEATSSRELARRSALNFLTLMFDQVGKLILSMILNRMILMRLDSVQYGVWQIMNRVVNFLTNSSGRPAEGLKIYIANSQHAQSNENRQRMIGSAIYAWLYFSPIYIIGGGLMAWFLPRNLDGLDPSLFQAVSAAVALLVLSLLLRELLSLPNMVLAGMNMRYKLLGVKVLTQFVSFLVAWGLLYVGWGLVGLSTAQIAGALALGVMAITIAKRNLPWLAVRKPLKGEVRKFMTFNGWMLLWRLMNLAISTMDVIIIGLVLNPATVALYTITNFMPLQVYNVVVQIVGASTASLGGLFGLGELKRVIDSRSEVLRIVWLFGLGSGLVILLFNGTFVTLWMEPEQYGGATLSLLLFLMVMQSAFIRVDSAIILLSLDIRQKCAIAATTTTAALLGAYFGLKEFGLPGAVAGMLCGRLVESIGYPFLISRQLKLPLLTQLKGTLRPLMVTGLLIIPCYHYEITISLNSWFTLVPAMVLTGLLGLGFGLLLGFSRKEQRQIVKRIRKLAKRK